MSKSSILEKEEGADEEAEVNKELTLSYFKVDYFEHQVEHIRQRFNWDCGVACVLMLLAPPQRRLFLDHFDDVCQQEGFHHSTWTVDLCYLLKRFGIEHEMYTTTMGVKEEYKKYSYYNDIFELDRERVEKRFEAAAAAGIRINERPLGAQRLLQHLARGPAIVLVDAAYLACRHCRRYRVKDTLKRCLGTLYTGHYVIAVGWALRGGRVRVLFRDPARRPRLCAASPKRLHAARTAPGTDQDIILIHRSYSQETKENKRIKDATLQNQSSQLPVAAQTRPQWRSLPDLRPSPLKRKDNSAILHPIHNLKPNTLPTTNNTQRIKTEKRDFKQNCSLQ